GGPLFSQRGLDVTEDVLFKWRLLVEQGRKGGHTFSQPYLFIAATALHHGLTVVSRDTREFELAGGPLCNPWRSRASLDFPNVLPSRFRAARESTGPTLVAPCGGAHRNCSTPAP